MTSQLLVHELTSLVQESKRKHPNVRQATEHALHEILEPALLEHRSSTSTTPSSSSSTVVSSSSQDVDARVSAVLAAQPLFVQPFLLACATKHPKITSLAVSSLQRLVAAKAVPVSSLPDVIQALWEAVTTPSTATNSAPTASVGGGLDVQLKVLQSLPSFLQNYAHAIVGDGLYALVNVCLILQTSQNAIVQHTTAATLQQMIVAVFDKLAAEEQASSPSKPETTDEYASTTTSTAKWDPALAEQLSPPALDAFRVFHDICLATEGDTSSKYLQIPNLSPAFGLELIESVLANHAPLFAAHPEQQYLLQTRVLPFLIQSLQQQDDSATHFAMTIRWARILLTLARHYLAVLPSEIGEALVLTVQLLDHPDSPAWKRCLCMEVFRGIFQNASLLRQIFLRFDGQSIPALVHLHDTLDTTAPSGGTPPSEGATTESKLTLGQRPKIVKILLDSLLRLATEQPTLLGLSQQTTLPGIHRQPSANAAAARDQMMLETGAMTGIGGSAAPPDEEVVYIGVNNRLWSSPRVQCLDQLDKKEPPLLPETYPYALILACITNLAEGLAKFILPLMHSNTAGPNLSASNNAPDTGRGGKPARKRSRKSAKRQQPVPITHFADHHPLKADIVACSQLLQTAWPTILALFDNFLTAALDGESYHNFVRGFQKLTHVTGLLQLDEIRNAFLSTLSQSAVPPQVVAACTHLSSTVSALATTPSVRSSVSVQPSDATTTAVASSSSSSRVSISSTASSHPPQPSSSARQTTTPAPNTLNTRNLLCLRALLNLGIALGPSLSGAAWLIVLATIQQADLVLYASNKVAGHVPLAPQVSADAQADQEATTLLSSFAAETKAVETAASRLVESTVDFSNEAFLDMVLALRKLFPVDTSVIDDLRGDEKSQPDQPSDVDAQPKKPSLVRTLSSSTVHAYSAQENHFVLTKLGDLASLNMERLLQFSPQESGWSLLTGQLIATLASTEHPLTVRMRAVETLMRLTLETASVCTPFPPEHRAVIQVRVFDALYQSLVALYKTVPITTSSSEEKNQDMLRAEQPSTRRDSRIPTAATTAATLSATVDIHKTILEGLKSILESCGETIISGWDTVFRTLNLVFVHYLRTDPTSSSSSSPGTASTTGGQSLSTIASSAATAKLVRASFGSLQLLCSDFLASLPNSCFLLLVDSLYRFSLQHVDLNIALTTVPYFWALSDFLSNRNSQSLSISAELMQQTDSEDLAKLEAMAADPQHPSSDAALWMLLLLRLALVTVDTRSDLRNSAIQTLLRIFDAYGDRLSAEAWSICIQSVIFRLLTSLEAGLASVHDGSGDGKNSAMGEGNNKKEWVDTADVMLEGVSHLLANYLVILVTDEAFGELWTKLLAHWKVLLAFHEDKVEAYVFAGLTKILQQAAPLPSNGVTPMMSPLSPSLSSSAVPSSVAILREDHVQQVWNLWSTSLPRYAEPADGKNIDENEEENGNSREIVYDTQSLMMYVATLSPILHLFQPAKISVTMVGRILQRLLDVLHASSLALATAAATAASGHAFQVNDIDGPTKLQTLVLATIEQLETKHVPGVAAEVVRHLADFVLLAFSPYLDLLSPEDYTSSFSFSFPSSSPSSDRQGSKKPSAKSRTNVALSKACMLLLRDTIIKHASEASLYTSGAFAIALDALAKPVLLKYRFPFIVTPPASSKSAQGHKSSRPKLKYRPEREPWKLATSSALKSLDIGLPQFLGMRITDATVNAGIWNAIVNLATGILRADGCDTATFAILNGANAGAAIIDPADIFPDQAFDIHAFLKLRDLITPSIGMSMVQLETRERYMQSLFQASLIHALDVDDAAQAEVIGHGDQRHQNDSQFKRQSLLRLPMKEKFARLCEDRYGRTLPSPATPRSIMSYVAFDELFSLVVSYADPVSSPSIVVQPPTPRFSQRNMHIEQPIPSLSTIVNTTVTNVTTQPIPEKEEIQGPATDAQDDESSPESSPLLRQGQEQASLDEQINNLDLNNRRRAGSMTSINTTASANLRSMENPDLLNLHLAKAAAPYVLCRAALCLRTYIADQPLRGRMPPPLTQRREVSMILQRLVTLCAVPDAVPEALLAVSLSRSRGPSATTWGASSPIPTFGPIPGEATTTSSSSLAPPSPTSSSRPSTPKEKLTSVPSSSSASSKRSGRWPLQCLYPLLVETARVAGHGKDEEMLSLVTEALSIAGGSF